MKYMGSKSRIAKQIVPIIQSYIDENNIKIYYECFCGGCNVIDKINCDNKYASDIHRYLIALLKRVQSDGSLYESVSRELYNKARDAVKNVDTSDFEDWQIGNIGFLASYNGRWFDGGYSKPGYEKTKKGERYRDYYKEAKQNLLNQAESLKDIQFNCCDYKNIFNILDNNNDQILIYCDPPYQGTKQYANAKEFDYDEFWETMREWSKKHIVLISEEHSPDDFECIWQQEVSRSIKASDKSKSVEKLFKYKGK